MDQRVRVKGAEVWEQQMDLMVNRVDHATRRATTRAGRKVERSTKLYLRTYTHRRGTPTPSPPGGPPALVTGALARSVRQGPTIRYRKGLYFTQVGPKAEYSRIQELGGRAGRNHAASLPSRPYLKPRTYAELVEIRKIYAREWREALRT